MASIIKIGSFWRALIRRKGHKPQCKTFRNKSQADVWARQREAEIDRGEVVTAQGVLTMGDLLSSYRELRDQSRPIADTSNEHYMLMHLEAGLGERRVGALSSQDLGPSVRCVGKKERARTRSDGDGDAPRRDRPTALG